MAQEITVAVLAERVHQYHETVKLILGRMDERQAETEKQVDELAGKVSKGEGTLGLLVKLVIGSVVVSVSAVAGIIGRAMRLW